MNKRANRHFTGSAINKLGCPEFILIGHKVLYFGHGEPREEVVTAINIDRSNKEDPYNFDLHHEKTGSRIRGVHLADMDIISAEMPEGLRVGNWIYMSGHDHFHQITSCFPTKRAGEDTTRFAIGTRFFNGDDPFPTPVQLMYWEAGFMPVVESGRCESDLRKLQKYERCAGFSAGQPKNPIVLEAEWHIPTKPPVQNVTRRGTSLVSRHG